MTHLQQRRRAFFILDVLASVTLILILIVTIVTTVRQYSVIRTEQDVRRTLRLAAENELHRIRAGVAPPATSPSAAPPGFEIVTTATVVRGGGPWTGFNHVSVVATKKITALRTATVRLSEYIPATGGEP